jgi:hypothetical protein
MPGRPVHLLAAAAIAATASVLSISPAAAGCFTGCGSYYTAPVAYYSAPVVYGYSYAAPAAYAAPCSPCGGYGYGYGYATPSYVVNQGPSYTEPVIGYADTFPAPSAGYRYGYGHGSAYPWYANGGVRWHRRHWGYRGYGSRYGYRAYGYRAFGQHRYRYGAVVPAHRHAMRHPIVGPGGIYRPHHPMVGRPIVGPRGIYRGPRHAMPGVVHPMNHATGAMPPRHGGPVAPLPKKRPVP